MASLFFQAMGSIVGDASEVGSSKGDNEQFNNIYFMDIALVSWISDQDFQYEYANMRI
jgi:hypothetical protein